ncbi:hypothetical protein FNYG_09984 [Fusarium nygamai]|uniref:Uncharacterized protein n=1 Tax=Gibberella nygamai TaxID=42673 RepID=A0A2K0W2R7_GIBNY|nr:hypothetical protein FNYG_09984 [Fusarium nygamai]
MKRPACKRCKSLEDTKNDSEKRPRMEHDRIRRHEWNAFRPVIFRDPNGMARPRSHTPPPHDHDFPNRTCGTVHGMDALPLGTVDNLRNHRSPSPATSDTSPSVGGYALSVTQSDFESRPQSPVSSTTSFEEECLPTRPGSLLAERISSSPLSAPPETYSESPSRSLSSEKSEVHLLFEPNLTSAVAEKSPSPSPMDIPETSCEMESDAIDSFEQQRLAIDDAVLPNQAERTHGWVMSPHIPGVAPHGSLETSPDHPTKEQYPATETIWKDSSSSDVDDDSMLPECDVQKPSKSQTMYTPMEIEPSDFGPNSTTIASLPECIRTRIMTFCIEPKDLLALISSSPVFLQPFCQNRRAIVSPMIKHMRFRFGGDMPRSCLMVARLRNMESKGAAGNTRARRAAAGRAIKAILSISPKGPLLHPVYSLRHLKFVSDTLDKAESVMSSYAPQAWANINGISELGPSHTAEELVLSMTERKRFMDSICLYDAYCTAFFSENAISSGDDTALRQSFLEEDGIPSEIIKRFYSIMDYLRLSYRDWIDMAIGKRHRDILAMRENHSLFPPLEKHIDPLINHFICSGPGVFRMLQDMRAPERYDILLRLLNRCETNAAYRQKITFEQGRGDKRMWPYREIEASLTMEEVQTAQHFWDPAIVWSVKPGSPTWPRAGLQLGSRSDARVLF